MNRKLWIGFLLLESVLYLAFMLLDLFQFGDTTWLKFLSILLVAFAGLLQAKKPDSRLLAAALCLTACADVFLLVLDRWYALGIGLFMIVQILYAVRLGSGKLLALQIIAANLAFLLLMSFGIIPALAGEYILFFAVNMLHAGAMALNGRERKSLFFFVGLALFFCCDLCVGLYNIASGALWQFARVAMWGFYLPGQVLILASGRDLGGNAS